MSVRRDSMRRVFTLLACAGLLLTISSSAIAAGSMSKDSTKSSGGSMNWLVGTWTCIAKMEAMPNYPAHTETDTMTFKPVMNGMWMAQTYTGKGFSSQAFWRWDKASKQLV